MNERLSFHLRGANTFRVRVGVPSQHPYAEEGLQRGTAPHSQPRPQPGVQGAVSGTYRGPRGAAARSLQRVVCRLGWQPGREELWRLAASHLPELAPRRAGCWDRRPPWTSLLTRCVSSAFGLVVSLGRSSPFKFFEGDLWFCEDNCTYFDGTFTMHFLIHRCV